MAEATPGGLPSSGSGSGTVQVSVWFAVGTLTGPACANGLTAPVEGSTWYLATATEIWFGDVTTGVITLASETELAETLVDISINATGNLKGMSVASDVLISIDKTTGAGTIAGPTGARAIGLGEMRSASTLGEGAGCRSWWSEPVVPVGEAESGVQCSLDRADGCSGAAA